MAFIKYRGDKHVVVTDIKKVTSGPHKGEYRMKTTKQVGKRPKGSTDYRAANHIYGR